MNRQDIKARFIEEFKQGNALFEGETMEHILRDCAQDCFHAYYNSIGDPGFQGRESDYYR